MTRPGRLGWLILLLALAGLGINAWLLAPRLVTGAAGVAGCGGGGCEEVLGSRWSAIFGVPVTVFGGLTYLGLIFSLTRRGSPWHAIFLGMIAGAAIWFIFVQAVLLGKFCPWCMTAHAVGLAAVFCGLIRSGFPVVAKHVARWGFITFLATGLMQIYGPVPATHRIDRTVATAPPAPVHARGEGRKISFDGGGKLYDVSALPRLGPLEANHVLVEYFDYQCAACRKMSGYVDALLARHPAEVAVLLLPMPLDGTCNPHLAGKNEHPGSCGISRVALAVWRARPEAFAAFHRKLIADPAPASARRLALEIVSSEQLESALAEPWIDELIQADIADWHGLSQSVDKLPKLLIRDQRILHGLPSGEADFIRVMERELGL